MKKLRFGLIGFAVIIIIGQLLVMDYGDLSWGENAGSYLGIFSMLFLIASMIYSNRYERAKGE